MWRTALGSVVGMLLGVGTAALILYVAHDRIARIKGEVFELEPNVTYLTVTLGAGFGSVCGALAGFASAVLREWRRGLGLAQQNSPPPSQEGLNAPAEAPPSDRTP